MHIERTVPVQSFFQFSIVLEDLRCTTPKKKCLLSRIYAGRALLFKPECLLSLEERPPKPEPPPEEVCGLVRESLPEPGSITECRREKLHRVDESVLS